MTKKYYIYFIIFYLIAAFTGIGISRIFYNLSIREKITQLKTEESTYLTLQNKILHHTFDEVYSDILYLSEQANLNSFLTNKSPGEKRKLRNDYCSFGKRKKKYDQIRILDINGMELIRVNCFLCKNNIKENINLQDKSDRYYFKESVEKTGIYVSPLDLNVENKKVEQPFKPVMRFGLKVKDLSGKEEGVIVLNYLGKFLLDLLKSEDSVSKGELYLMNKEGYFLHGPDKDVLWGFMIKNREHETFQHYHPLLWQNISKNKSGQKLNSKGLYTWTTFSTQDDKNWFFKIVSHIPPSRISEIKKRYRKTFIVYNSTVLVLLAFLIFLLTFIAYRRRQYQKKLMWSANYDALTGLANRSMFFTILERTIYNASRYKEQFAVLFIDIDGFKMVNDTLGHDIGDKILIAIASRLKDCVRESDLVARLGGDEFIILINRIQSPSDAEIVAQKLIDRISEIFYIDENNIVVGACIGISIYPENGKNPDLLIKKADNEMYRCKKKGKNCYSLCKTGDIDGIY